MLSVIVFGLAAVAGSAAAQSADTPQAGVAGAVVGGVDVSGKPRPEPMSVRSGMDIFLQDRIATASESRLQVLLLDETVFTVGPGSEVVIDRFVYDPESGAGKVGAKVTKGFMRYVSGKVGKENPQNVTIETPASTIGIRGTSLYVSQVPGQPDTYVAGLLGPGPENNARARRGGFTMRNEHGSVTVSQPGFGVYVTKGQAPEPPTRLSQDLLDRLHTGLRPRRGRRADVPDAAPAGAGKADPVQASGEAVAGTRVSGLETEEVRETLSESASDSTEANAEANRRPEETRSLFAEAPPEPPRNVSVPLFAQAQWDGLPDLGLHVTGPNPERFGRFHVFFPVPEGPIGPSGKPVAVLDNDASGVTGSEVATINDLIEGGNTRISVFNFGNPAPETTLLADEANLSVSLLKNGSITRGPGGSVVVSGELLDRVAPPEGEPGNTFVAFEITPGGDVERIREMRDFPNAGLVQ